MVKRLTFGQTKEFVVFHHTFLKYIRHLLQFNLLRYIYTIYKVWTFIENFPFVIMSNDLTSLVLNNIFLIYMLNFLPPFSVLSLALHFKSKFYLKKKKTQFSVGLGTHSLRHLVEV